jgi:hypothetical protein
MPLDMQLPGQYGETSGAMLRNETGATIVKGGVAIVDMTQTEPRTTR